MNILKSLVVLIAIFSLASLSTHSVFTSQAIVAGNQFSTGVFPTPEPTSSQATTARICHATGAENHYTNLTLPIPAILSGHVGHQCGNDIIPPFDYGDPIQHFAGQNWDTEGQAIWNNNCEIVVVSPAE